MVKTGRSRLGRVALAVGLVVGVLLVGEWIARRLDPQASFRELHRMRPGAPWLYDMVPGAVAHDPANGIDYRIASHGFRDREREQAKPPGVFRIAVLGDSLTFGYGVAMEDGFVARLEEELSRGRTSGDGDRIEVLNFGISGYNPFNETELFRGVVGSFAPDLTLVQFCINDLNDPRLHFGASTTRRLGDLPEAAFPNPERALEVDFEIAPLAAACDRSALCRALLAPTVGSTRTPGDRDELRETFELRDGLEFATEWAWLREQYARLSRIAHEGGSAFGVVAFPHAGQFDPRTPGAGEAIAAMGREEGFEVIDLFPAFADSGAGATELFLDVWHPSVRGHGIAATSIAETLLERSAVPGVKGALAPEEMSEKTLVE